MFHKKEDGKLSCYHGALAWVIAILLLFILLLMSFRVGLLLGSTKSHFSSCNYKKDYRGHLDKKIGGWKKVDYLNYKKVTKLTDTGFEAVDAKGNGQTIVVNEETKIFKGKVSDGVEISVDDKVYVEATKNEAGQFVASVVKIYEEGFDKFKK